MFDITNTIDVAAPVIWFINEFTSQNMLPSGALWLTKT